MNDFELSSLANDRRDTLLAEADRQRLARSSRAPRSRSHVVAKPAARQRHLGAFFSRISLF